MMIKKFGFSLVEVIIVISIMAFLAITVLGGRNLITAAKIQSVINHLTTYEQGVFNFYLQYNYLPGDFPNTEVWLEDDIKNICNKVDTYFNIIPDSIDRDFIRGDGDGYVATAWDDGSYPAESDIVSCHLALSNYLSLKKLGRGIPEAFSDPNSNNKVFLEKSKDQITGYWIDDKNYLTITSHVKNRNMPVKNTQTNIVPTANNFIILSGRHKYRYTSTSRLFETTINSYTLSVLDKKIDDGKPGMGKVIFGSWMSNEFSAYKEFCSHYTHFTYLCAKDSHFLNISNLNINSAYMLYQPKWLYNLMQ